MKKKYYNLKLYYNNNIIIMDQSYNNFRPNDNQAGRMNPNSNYLKNIVNKFN